MTATDRQTIRVLYAGRVQGVGFRYTVREIVRQHPVDGYVRNLPDGQVELVAQAASPQLDGLLAAIAERFRGNIDGIVRQEMPQSEDFNGFQIRH